MKSPCHDCDHYNADKNNSICMKCDARVKYAQGLNACLDPSIKIERRSEGMRYKKGTCNNCERPDMYLPARGRCWMCYDSAQNAQRYGESVEAALAVTKERVKSGVSLHRKYRTKKSPEDSAITKADLWQEPEKTELKPVTYKTGKALPLPGVNVVPLEFIDERDEQILEVIEAMAAESRRSPEQEIMWILQHYVEASKEELFDGRVLKGGN